MLNSNDIIVEKSLLCWILRERIIPEGVTADLFTGDRRVLFENILHQWSEHQTVEISVMPEQTMATALDCLDSMDSCAEIVITRLKSYAMIREAQLIYGSKVNESLTEPEDILPWLREQHEKISGIITSNQVEKYDHDKNIVTCMVFIEEGCRLNKFTKGIQVKIPTFDKFTNGFEQGKQYVIGALKKTGKSKFMIYCAIQMAEAGKGIYINSIEMTPEQVNLLVLSYYSGINSRRLGLALTKEEIKCTGPAALKAKNLNWIIGKQHTISELRTKILAEKSRRKIDYVFIDFAQRMRSEKYGKDRVREVEDLSKGFADLSRDFNIGVIVLSQLSGLAERLDKDVIPDMSYLKESQGLAENADTIITLHNPTRNENPFTQEGSYIVPDFTAKIEQRYDISGATATFRGDLRTCHFYEI